MKVSQDAIRHGLDVITRHRGFFSLPTITGKARGGSQLNRVRCLIAGQLSADGRHLTRGATVVEVGS